MRWAAPLERREVALILFSISAYLLAYNIETSLNYVGIDPVAAQGALFRTVGLGRTKVIADDGRKPYGWRDTLELSIFGHWGWQKDYIAGYGTERSQRKGTGRHGAQWMERRVARSLDSVRFGESTVNDAHRWWMDDIPTTRLVKHIPGVFILVRSRASVKLELGYTILDNVIIHNGSIYLVTDDASSLPPTESIIETTGLGFRHGVQVLLKSDALKQLGKYGGV